MPSLRHDDILLRLIKDVNDIRASLRRVVANFPLYDIANENTPAQLTTNQNNYVPGNYDIILLSSSQNIQITGIANGVKGRKLQIFNVGNYSIILPYENSDSLAQNRFRFQSGYSAIIEPGTNITLYYYAALQRWITGTETVDIAGRWSVGTCPVGDWYSVTYSPDLNLFVAVGAGNGDGATGNFVMTSPDGFSWTAQTAPAPGTALRRYGSVCWSPSLGLFVAVGNGTTNQIITSPNGIAWTAQTPASVFNLNCVAWSETLGIFVAAGGDGTTNSPTNKIQTSTDGVVWTNRTSPQTQSWLAIIWADSIGKFVMVGGTTFATYRAAYSFNGTSWTGVSDAASSVRDVVAWSESLSLFISTHSNTDQVGIASPDGVTWTRYISIPRASGMAWSDVIGSFLTVGTPENSEFNKSYYSFDGFGWVQGASYPNQYRWRGMCWSSEKNIYVAVGLNNVMTSPS